MDDRLSSGAIEDVQQILGCVLPEPLLALYNIGSDASEINNTVEIRLMPFAEIISLHQTIQEEDWNDFATKGVRFFWTDDDGNFVGLYITGLLEGRLCFVDHEEVDLSPSYTSVQSFVNTLAEASSQDSSWRELRRDYPTIQLSVDPQADLRDWETAQSFRSLYENSQDDNRIYYAFCTIVLTPYAKTDTLLRFTYDDNMHIQAKACEVLGQRKYEPAIDRLAEVAKSEGGNGRISSIIALGRIGSEPSRSYLQDLFPALPEGYHNYIKAALSGWYSTPEKWFIW